jgi:hypothetical protein
LSLINISIEAACGMVKISNAPRIKIERISDGFRPGLGQLSDNARTQNELTALDVRRAVWNGACYGCPLLRQGEQRPSLNHASFRRRRVTSPAQPDGVFTGGI